VELAVGGAALYRPLCLLTSIIHRDTIPPLWRDTGVFLAK